MVKIDDEVIRLILKNGNIVLVGSTDSKGIPNISPRFVLDILGEEKLLFADAFKNKTFANVTAWPKVTVAILDKDTMGGFQLKGDVKEVEDKDLISLAEKRLSEHEFNQKPHKVWTLEVKEIYSLKPSEKSRIPLTSAYA